MYTLDCDATIHGELADVWATWSDMVRYPEWDRREEELRLDGPFQAGTAGWSKQVGPRPGSPFRLVRVEPPAAGTARWTNESPLPGGKLVIDHHLTARGDGTVHVLKRYQVHGPMQPAFALIFSRAIRRDTPGTFAALETETARRAAA